MSQSGEQTKKAIEILRSGGIVVFPTDTAFGVGCRMDDKEAVERLFRIRRRPQNQAAPVLVENLKMAQEYLLPIPQEVVEKLIKPSWPGGLTLILPCLSQKVEVSVRGGGSTLGVRIPNHPIPLALIRGVGIPILGPSANFHGERTPHKMSDLNPEFLKLVDYVVPGECSLKEASTVIDCSKKPWKIIRQGALRLSASWRIAQGKLC